MITACIMALVAGVIFSQMLTPITYIEESYDGASQNGLDYFFAFALGAFVSATVAFVGYCVFMKNRPHAEAQVEIG